MKWILASQSPRRKELLKLLDHPFDFDQADIEETLRPDLALPQSIEDLAQRKAFAVSHKHPTALIIAADTVVVLGQTILGKPKDAQDAFSMLKSLSGHTHQVITSMALYYQNQTHTFSSITRVTFYELSDQAIQKYVDSKECMDKAGAYGIQDHAALFIEKIEGDYYTVMGLPVALLHQEIEGFLSRI